jgi:predicted dehydrogenase
MPRREFLQKLAVLVGTTAIFADLPWWSPLRAAPPGASPADRVRLAVIGTGSRGNRLLLNLLRTPGVEIAALCDDYEPNLQAALKNAGGTPPVFSDYRRVLEQPDIDGVVIATPLHLHAPICLAAFAAGKHVFCEKSLAYTFEECRAVARTARASGRVFQVGHQRLYSAEFLRAHELLRAGEIGPLTQIRAYWHRSSSWRRKAPPELERRLNWRLYRDTSAGLMTELASHHLHAANWFLSAPPLSCVGYGSINFWKDGRELYDNVNVVYRYPDGVHVIYDSILSNRFHGQEIQLIGTRGTIELETGRIYAENPPPAPGIVQLVNQLEKGFFETIPLGGPSWVPDLKQDTKGRPLLSELSQDDGTALQLAAFANAVRTGAPIPGMIEHAYNTGIAALMGQFAMEQDREIAWPEEFVS